jgi:hypothetical protein
VCRLLCPGLKPILLPITGEEAQKLTENAAVVASLEDLFSSRHVYFVNALLGDIDISSIRHKDRTSQISQLDPTESERFRCGVYRLMLLSEACPASGGEIDEEYADAKAAIRLERKRFLEEFPNHELLVLHSITLFLAELMEWLGIAGMFVVGQSIHFNTFVTI